MTAGRKDGGTGEVLYAGKWIGLGGWMLDRIERGRSLFEWCLRTQAWLKHAC